MLVDGNILFFFLDCKVHFFITITVFVVILTAIILPDCRTLSLKPEPEYEPQPGRRMPSSLHLGLALKIMSPNQSQSISAPFTYLKGYSDREEEHSALNKLTRTHTPDSGLNALHSAECILKQIVDP